MAEQTVVATVEVAAQADAQTAAKVSEAPEQARLVARLGAEGRKRTAVASWADRWLENQK